MSKDDLTQFLIAFFDLSGKRKLYPQYHTGWALNIICLKTIRNRRYILHECVQAIGNIFYINV